MRKKLLKPPALWALLALCGVLYVVLVVRAALWPSPAPFTEVASRQVVESPVPRLLLPTLAPMEAPLQGPMRTLDLNRADAWMLRAVPGIGEEMAGRIVAYRQRIGGFTDVRELMRVQGIGESTYEKIVLYVHVEPENAAEDL